MPKRVGIISDKYSKPLFRGLGKYPGSAFELVEGSSAQNAIKLRQGSLDGAFLSPIEYARDCRDYRIVPEVGAVSEGESGAILLVFKEQALKIATVAADPNCPSEIVLAHILLSEKYDSTPRILPYRPPEEGILSRADAVLLVGDRALEAREKRNKLDLVDEWKDVTDLPYVHGVWVFREGLLEAPEAEMLANAGKMGYPPIEQDYPGFRYNLGENAVAGLSEFFRMAYYHGILKEIPDIKFFSPDSADNPEE